MKTGTSWYKNTLFAAGAIIIPLALIIIAAEMAARHFDAEIRLEDGLRNPFWAPHPTRHHALKPGEYNDTVWGITFRINKLGFRGPEVSRQKPEGTIRIVCMGDSVTMGPALPDEATYPRILEDMLREKYPGHKFEVINAGISGYEIEEEYLQFKDDILVLEPDAVTLQFCLNDVPGVKSADLINPTRSLALPGKEFLLSHLALARFLQERYNRIGLKNSFLGMAGIFEMKPNSPEAKRIEKGWSEYGDKLKKIAQTCRQWKINFMVLIVPHAAQFEDRQERFIPQKRIKVFAQKAGFHALDLAPVFSAQEKLPYVYPDPVHLHPLGHKIIAKNIIEWLEKTSLIKSDKKRLMGSELNIKH